MTYTFACILFLSIVFLMDSGLLAPNRRIEMIVIILAFLLTLISYIYVT